MPTLLQLQNKYGKRDPEIRRYRLQSLALSVATLIAAALIFIFLLVLIPVFIRAVNAEPLDAVIDNLLNAGPNNNEPCFRLESAGPTPDRLTGALEAFCDQVGSGSATTSGGGATTPQTAPGIVQDRLQAVKEDQGQSAQTATISELAPGWNLFLSAEGETLDRDVTPFEDGYDSDVWRVTVGTDFQPNDKGTVGLAFTYSNHKGDFEGGGDFDNESYGVIAFAAVAPKDNVFVQATMGYASKGYDRTRTVATELSGVTNQIGPGSVKGDFDGNEFSTGVLVGYDHAIGRLTIGPRIGIDWIFTEFDSYTEQGDTGLELVLDDTDETSFQSRVGFAGSFAVSTGFGVLVPQISADWVHEFADSQRTLAFSFADDPAGVKFTYEDEEPDTDFFELAIGLSAVLPNGWLPYAQFRTIVGHEFLDSYVGSVGLRLEF